jgi:1,4-alpha-glucan branching enzyme
MVQKTYFKTKDYAKVKFSVNLENAETVEVLGLNSDWENGVILSRKKDGSFAAEVQLPKNSQHEFKYRVNASEWVNEPEADGELANAFGGSNSLLVIE